MDAVDFLTQQHRRLEEYLGQAVNTADRQQRCELFRRAADHLSTHMTSEEEIFYPAVKQKRTQDILLESLEEHLALKRLLADLLELDVSAQTFEAKLKVLREQTEHHHKEEEEHLFPKVKKCLDHTHREQLGREMDALQARMARAGEPRQEVRHQTGSAAPL